MKIFFQEHFQEHRGFSEILKHVVKNIVHFLLGKFRKMLRNSEKFLLNSLRHDKLPLRCDELIKL